MVSLSSPAADFTLPSSSTPTCPATPHPPSPRRSPSPLSGCSEIEACQRPVLGSVWSSITQRPASAVVHLQMSPGCDTVTHGCIRMFSLRVISYALRLVVQFDTDRIVFSLYHAIFTLRWKHFYTCKTSSSLSKPVGLWFVEKKLGMVCEYLYLYYTSSDHSALQGYSMIVVVTRSNIWMWNERFQSGRETTQIKAGKVICVSKKVGSKAKDPTERRVCACEWEFDAWNTDASGCELTEHKAVSEVRVLRFEKGALTRVEYTIRHQLFRRTIHLKTFWLTWL